MIFEKNEEREIRVFISTVDFAENSLDRKSAKFWTGYMCWLRWEKSKNIFSGPVLYFRGSGSSGRGTGGRGVPDQISIGKLCFSGKMLGAEIRVFIFAVDCAENRLD